MAAQVYLGDDEWAGEEEDPLGNVMCMECGRGDDESNLMLCDGMLLLGQWLTYAQLFAYSTVVAANHHLQALYSALLS